jgi:hypothetical protein
MDFQDSRDLITDVALASLSKVGSLESLGLYYGKFTDKGLEHLSGLPKLKSLAIPNCRTFTDAGLEHLSKLSHLEHLDLRRGSFSDAGLERLKEALPNCDIKADVRSARANAVPHAIQDDQAILEQPHREELVPKGVDIRGQLVDSTGAAIPGARLFLRRHVWINKALHSTRTPDTRLVDIQATDSAGRFAFTGLPRDSSFFLLEYKSPQYARTQARIVMRPPATQYDVRIQLAPEDKANGDSSSQDRVARVEVSHKVSPRMPALPQPSLDWQDESNSATVPGSGWAAGRVLYEDGTPVLGAAVMGDFKDQVEADGGFRVQLAPGRNTAIIDLAEAICWPRVPEGTRNTPVRYLAQSPDGGMAMRGGEVSFLAYVPVEVKTGQVVAVGDVVLNRRSVTTLRVQCEKELVCENPAGDRSTLSGSQVALLVDAGNSLLTYYSWDWILDRPEWPIRWIGDNEFVVEDAPAGKKTLIVSGPDLLWYRLFEGNNRGTVQPLGPVEVEVVAGHVYDATGAPVEGACVIARCAQLPNLRFRHRSGLDPPFGSIWTKTKSDGSFKLRLGVGHYHLTELAAADMEGILVDVKPGQNPEVVLTIAGPLEGE